MTYKIRNILILGFSILLFTLAIIILPLPRLLFFKALGKTFTIILIVQFNLLWIIAYLYQTKIEKKNIRKHSTKE